MSLNLKHVPNVSNKSFSKLIHLGAGRCHELDVWLQAGFESIVLVEANKILARDLRRKSAEFKHVVVCEHAISGQSGSGELSIFNYSDVSSLREPDQLHDFFPGISLRERVSLPVMGVGELLRTFNLNAIATNGLVIETPGEERAILEALMKDDLLSKISFIIMRVPAVPLYVDGGPMEDIESLLLEMNFHLTIKDDSDDSIRPVMLFERDHAAVQIKELELLLKNETERKEQLENDLAAAYKKNRHLDMVLLEKETLEKLLENETRQREQMESEVDRMSDVIRRLEIEAERQVAVSENLAKLLKEELLNPILSRIDNSAKQVESYIALNEFFDGKELLPDLHGWPISPDLAIYVMRLIKENDYDLVIEFGSGSSTVLMAKAIAQKLLGRSLKDVQGNISELLLEGPSPPNRRNFSKSPARTISTQGDIVPRLVAFEHIRKYFERTSMLLQQSGLSNIVQLVHAPLHDYQSPEGSRFLYYDCAETLYSLSKRVDQESARIMVLVDGPPARTGIHARYPALPAVLKYFGSSQIDFVLDDTNRNDEKDVLKMWEQEIERRGMKGELVHLKFEKGAAIFRVH